jgi:hypothetical protein
MGQVAIPVEPSPRLPSEARCTDLFGSSVEETIIAGDGGIFAFNAPFYGSTL